MKPRSPFRFITRLLAAALAFLPHAGKAQDQPPTDDEILGILRTRIDTQKRGVGIVVGWVDEHGSRIVPYGHTSLGDGNEVNGRTIFEIGSVTKVFTSLLLELAVERGEVKLSDPVAKYLPAGAKIPERGGRKISLLDLATHRSGLPSMPDNFKPKNESNPYADYTVEQMFAFLSAYTLPREIGGEYEYSNLGVGLLGQALSRRAGTDYESLVVKEVCKPLGMADTSVTLTPDLQARLALPYDTKLAPAHNWDLPTFAGAGALRSDVDDMLKFVAANLQFTKSGLTPALLATHETRNSAGGPSQDIALGWHINKQKGTAIIWHNGGTGGYRSFVGFDSARRRGVVILSNTANGVDDIGLRLFNGPPKSRTAIRIAPELGDRYVGRYQIVPEFILTFSREGDRYFLQATGQGRNEVFPETETDFFLKVVDAQISFEKDSSGVVTALVLHQGGEQTAKRLP